MNARLNTWAAIGLLSAGAPALAASTVDLAVNGLITPTACTPTLSSGGLIDFGKISQQDLNADKGTRLPRRNLTLAIDCDGLSRFALRMRDNRDGTAMVNSEIYYGLGLDNAGNRIGLYSVTFDPTLTVADSHGQIFGTDSTTAGLAWRMANLNPIQVGARSYLGFTDIQGSTSGPAALQHLTSLLGVEVVIAAKQVLDLSTDVRLDGSGTLELVYL